MQTTAPAFHFHASLIAQLALVLGCSSSDHAGVTIADSEVHRAYAYQVTEGSASEHFVSGYRDLGDGTRVVWTRDISADGDIIDRHFTLQGDEILDDDLASIERASRERVWSQRGAMDESLAERLGQSQSLERFRVWAWMRLEGVPEVRGDSRGRESIDDQARVVFADIQERLSGRSALSATHVDGPFIKLELSREELVDLAWSGLFIQINEEWLDRGPGTAGAWYNTVGTNIPVFAGWTGSGRRVAIIEPGAPTAPGLLAPIVAQASGVPPGYVDSHMQQCAGMVADRIFSDPHSGSAPSAGLVIANWAGFSGPQGDIRLWAAHQSVDVMSNSRLGTEWDGPPNVNDLYNDWTSLRSPYPVMVLLAGNDGAPGGPDDYVHHRGYNTISVGASNDMGTALRSDDVIAAFSSWKNPSTPNNDRELPEIVAPGVNVCGGGLCGDGTSFATPIVAGTAALLRHRNPLLQTYPEAVKAMIMASADCTVEGPLLNLADTHDDKDGAGLLNAARAVSLAASSLVPLTHATSGHDYGQLTFGSPSQWSGVKYVGAVHRARTDSTGRLAIVLTWNSTPTCSNEHSSSSCSGWGPDGDLNLALRNATTGALVRTSLSKDNNYEVIYLLNGGSNQNYFIEIWKSSAAPRNPSTYFGLAWTTWTAGCPNP